MKAKIQKFIESEIDYVNCANNYALGFLTEQLAKERLSVLLGLAETIGDYKLADRVSNIYNHL